MPMSCVAYGCSSRDSPSRTVRFFRFPSVKRDRQRREAWIRAVKRQDAQGRPWQPSAASRLCGKHFVTGAPSPSPRHPDFIPTLFVYTDQFRKKDAVDRHVRTAARSKRKTGAPPTAGTEVSGQGGTCKGLSDGEPDTSCVQGADSSFDEEGAADALLLLATSPMLTEPQEVLEPTPLSREENTDHLLTENVALQRKVRDLELQCRKLKRCTFSVDTIHKSSFKFYTGLQSKEQFEALFKHIEKNAERMVYWDGGKTQAKERQLSKREELFMVLYRLRTGVCAKEVARIFGISQSCLSRIFCTWVIFLDKELSALTRFPTLAEIKRHMPMAFSDFSNTRVILDCTEVSSSLPRLLNNTLVFSRTSPSYTEVARRGAAPHRSAAAQVTRRVTAVTPSAPLTGTANAVPSPANEGQQTSGPVVPRASAHSDRPTTPAKVPAPRALSTASDEVMDTSTNPASLTPKDRRSSLERAGKKERARIKGPEKVS
ncbi:uncharacterized protein [Dermacentor albipictus]|uniref:uncharacterized protein n=1 Tax=Dermacentor albipictus TaxID=60249 RepID=UPI0038FBFC5F